MAAGGQRRLTEPMQPERFMHENDPDARSEAAHRLAEVDPALAAEALRTIVADDTFDPDGRSEAAHKLAEVESA